MNIRFELSRDSKMGGTSKTETFDYFQYDKSGNKIDHTAEISINVFSAYNQTGELITHTIKWLITLDEKTISSNKISIDHPIAQSEAEHVRPEKPLFSDAFHHYNYHYNTSVSAVDFTIHGDLAQYSYLVEK